MPWTATKSDAYVRLTDHYPVGQVDYTRDLTPTEARALAAELVRAADEVEPVERSCFTCAHRNNAVYSCAPFLTERPRGPVTTYVVESGAIDAPGGMPTNRSLSCPGWAAKVTT